jgi:hypothetical protein
MFLRFITAFLFLFPIYLALPRWASAQGDCGSVCVPLDALDPDKTQLRKNQM